MNRKFILLGEQFLVITGLQIVALNYLKSAVVPSFFLIWLLILVWEENIEISLFMAFLTGIIYDVSSKGIYGITSIIFLIIVYINCFLKVQDSTGRIAGIFIFSIMYFLMTLFKYPEGFLWNTRTIIRYSLLFAFYNSVAGFFIDTGMRRLRSKWKMRRQYLLI
ncbi:MAG: rod shape-determining protein MreD [Candidatus Ratteibacteria bacterium]|nr:rod shape-determining protein MreD [Candidatus Ratteibacteria bacterium]